MKPYKFVKHEVPALETLKDSFPARMRKKLDDGQSLAREEKNQLYRQLFGNTFSKTGIPLRGWMFPFRDVLKRFYVEYTYGHIQVTYSIDKTAIRAYESSIYKITEAGG
jgi:hypothetical protein